MIGAALAVEALKLRRSTTALVAGLAVALLAPGLAAGFVGLARTDTDGVLSAKVRPLLEGLGAAGTEPGWSALLGLTGQVLSVGMLLAGGVVTAWSFGREHVEGTWGALFALPTSRREVATAKLVVLLAWGVATTAAAGVVALVLGALAGLGPLGGDAAATLARSGAVALLTVVLTVPFAWVASVARGYLPAVGVLLGVVVATQVATVLGAGAWFPWAAPGMWAGLGGEAAAAAVTPVQLLLALPVGALGGVATVAAWQRAQVR